MMKTYPRTLREYCLVDLLQASGIKDEKIEAILNRIGRSEILTLDGRSHCAHCIQPINLRTCPECGQSLADGKES